jgi:hypothetical protein
MALLPTRPASTPIPVFDLRRQLEGRIRQMTAAESFDAGIARQIGHYADAVRYLPATTRSSSPGH